MGCLKAFWGWNDGHCGSFWKALIHLFTQVSNLAAQLTPILALLLVHDFLLAKNGIALPQSHGLRSTIERHKGRLTSEFTRARIRRKQPTLEALRAAIAEETRTEGEGYPRWVRVNALKSDLDTQLETTFSAFKRVFSIADVMGVAAAPEKKVIYIDEHVPNLLAVSPGVDLTKSEAYKSGALILQDKASCFPAYLLDPDPGHGGDVIDACAAPGNKTTHLAAILHSRVAEHEKLTRKVYAFEKDANRAQTLAKMVDRAGGKGIVRIALGQDFLKVDPREERYRDVVGLLLDPSCSGSGIVGRDSVPELHLPEPPLPPGVKKKSANDNKGKKRKRGPESSVKDGGPVLLDDDGNAVAVGSEQELAARLRALATFQLNLLLHALEFPAARRVTYSTCSVHAEENEEVVLAALNSEVARRRGWRVLRREEQVSGMREWPVRGEVGAARGDEVVAESCIRSYKGDGRGVMGFFVAGFVREGDERRKGEGRGKADEEEEPFVRDEEGMIVRDALGMPLLKATGEFMSVVPEEDGEDGRDGQVDAEEEEEDVSSDDSEEGSVGEDEDEDEDDEEWGGFDD